METKRMILAMVAGMVLTVGLLALLVFVFGLPVTTSLYMIGAAGLVTIVGITLVRQRRSGRK